MGPPPSDASGHIKRLESAIETAESALQSPPLSDAPHRREAHISRLEAAKAACESAVGVAKAALSGPHPTTSSSTTSLSRAKAAYRKAAPASNRRDGETRDKLKLLLPKASSLGRSCGAMQALLTDMQDRSHAVQRGLGKEGRHSSSQVAALRGAATSLLEGLVASAAKLEEVIPSSTSTPPSAAEALRFTTPLLQRLSDESRYAATLQGSADALLTTSEPLDTAELVRSAGAALRGPAKAAAGPALDSPLWCPQDSEGVWAAMDCMRRATQAAACATLETVVSELIRRGGASAAPQQGSGGGSPNACLAAARAALSAIPAELPEGGGGGGGDNPISRLQSETLPKLEAQLREASLRKVKLHFGDEIRVTTVPHDAPFAEASAALFGFLGMSGGDAGRASIRYKDATGDYITVKTTSEWRECWEHFEEVVRRRRGGGGDAAAEDARLNLYVSLPRVVAAAAAGVGAGQKLRPAKAGAAAPAFTIPSHPSAAPEDAVVGLQGEVPAAPAAADVPSALRHNMEVRNRWLDEADPFMSLRSVASEATVVPSHGGADGVFGALGARRRGDPKRVPSSHARPRGTPTLAKRSPGVHPKVKPLLGADLETTSRPLVMHGNGLAAR